MDRPDLGLQQLTEVIVSTARKHMIYSNKSVAFKKGWYDWECLRMRKYLYNLLNIFRNILVPA